MKKVFIVPGYQASPTDHWFPWLSNQITQYGAQCTVINFTNSAQPDLATWRSDLSAQMQVIDEDTIIIAHSLGCITSLDYLSHQRHAIQLTALITIAGFYQNLPSLPELNDFIQQAEIADGMLRSHIRQRYAYFSINDTLVPAPFCIRFGQLLNAQMIEVKQAGHFMAEDGYLQFPALWERVKALIDHVP